MSSFLAGHQQTSRKVEHGPLEAHHISSQPSQSSSRTGVSLPALQGVSLQVTMGVNLPVIRSIKSFPWRPPHFITTQPVFQPYRGQSSSHTGSQSSSCKGVSFPVIRSIQSFPWRPPHFITTQPVFQPYRGQSSSCEGVSFPVIRSIQSFPWRPPHFITTQPVFQPYRGQSASRTGSQSSIHNGGRSSSHTVNTKLSLEATTFHHNPASLPAVQGSVFKL